MNKFEFDLGDHDEDIFFNICKSVHISQTELRILDSLDEYLSVSLQHQVLRNTLSDRTKRINIEQKLCTITCLFENVLMT